MSATSVDACIESLATGGKAMAAGLASVVPSVDSLLRKSVMNVLGIPLRSVRYTMKLGASISYPDPESIGADRLANVASGVQRYGTPLIIVDVGTATTFDVILARKGYVGGVIAPGPDLMLSYLEEKTALLPKTEFLPIRNTVGTTTEQAMRLGAVHGYRGMVKEITQQLMRRMPRQPFTLCATGGYARWVLKGMDLPFNYDRDLTLDGIVRILELNS